MVGSLFFAVQKMKFLMKDFFSKCNQIRRKLRIRSHLLKEFLMENFSFCAVYGDSFDSHYDESMEKLMKM